ncbi:MAG: ABC transporter permease [Chloroflexi bacterium]|nr:ABC transporter permease [Chloroflexota bacterium]
MNAPDLVYDSKRHRFALFADIAELVRYRDLLWSLVQRDLTVRYKRSVLGFLWTMLNPLLVMLVMTIVFSTFFRFSIEHYAVYLLSGTILWNFFAQSTSMAMHNLVWAGGLVNKIYIPKSVFVVSAIFVGLVNFLLALIPLSLIMLFTGQSFSPTIFFLPIPIFLMFIFALGVGLAVSALAVFFADVIDIYQVALTVLMYLTPLFYPVDIVPEKYLLFIHLNPVYYFIEIFRQPIYQGVLPETYLLLRAALVALTALVIGWWFFTRKSNEFAYRV